MKIYAFFGKIVIGIVSVIFLWATVGFADFPERTIQVLVGWPVGTPNDTMDRAITKPLSKILGKTVIVKNIPGAGGTLVLGRLKTEKPDGYTIFQTGLPMFSQTPWMRAVSYDPLNDFAYLAQHMRYDFYMLCNSDSPWKTYEELIQDVKKNPKTIKFGTTGVGSSGHIMMEYLALKENLKWVHVPYNSSAEGISGLLGKHIDFIIIPIGYELEFIKTGRFRPLLAMSSKRAPQLPDLPTVTEKGYEFSIVSSAVWAVSAKTPKNIQQILEKALLQAINDPEARGAVTKLNKTCDPVGSEELTKTVFANHQKYGELLKTFKLGIFKK